ncbi:MAG: 30S ribosomal protein S7 [Bacteroidota bacterium]|nr:30S ribosomal protein S7 [Bacteroidota bacterium]
MRKGQAKKREINPDPIYNDILVTKFVNNLMEGGKKSKAYKIVYGALEIIKTKIKEENELEVWKKALRNVMPSVEVKGRRIGGATFQIPTEVSEKRRLSLGMKWMISFSRKRSGKTMTDNLANEVLAAYKNEGGAVKKKEEMHRMAEANKAFSHFRF